ncbi:MAG: hypothetical protein ACUVYA_15570 [Planctomycetota bacterium]
MGQGAFRFDETSCAQLAARIEMECRNAGSDEATCFALREKFEALCRNSQPPAPPVFDCREQCRREAELELRGCLEQAGGDPEAQAQCRAAFEARLGACVEGCAFDLDCKETCHLQAVEAMDACRKQGGGNRECQRVYAEAFQACLANCEPVEPPSCAQLCVREAEAVRARWRAQGGDPRRSEVAYQAALRECLRRCEPGPVPEPPGCPGACFAQARSQAAACVEAGGDPKTCWSEVQASLEECLAGCERVPPFPCGDQCRLEAAETFFGCLAEAAADEDGLTSEEAAACAQAADGAFEACLASCEPGAEPPTCDERCQVRAKRFFDVCVEEGNDPGECAAKALEISATCMERCDEMPPARCAYACVQGARGMYEECMTPSDDNPDPDPEACRAAAIQFLEECRTTCERPQPPGCAERCANYAERVRARCAEAGGDEETCAQRAERAREYCAAGCPPRPKPCPEVCAERARLYRALCVELGGDPETCGARAQNMIASCQERCERPPKPPCAENCLQRARHIYADCIESGGDPEQCRAQAMEWADECAARCAPRPSPCAEECARAARGQYAACLDAIDEAALAEACRGELGDGATEDDIAACVLAKKAEATEACKVAANESLAACLKDCRTAPPPEPLACPERCDRIAEKLLALCGNLDPEDPAAGEPSECAERVAAFLERCKAACEKPQPPGPCGIDCGAIAARIQAECEAAGGEDCGAVAARFQARCEARAAEHCQDETIATEAPPRRFFRGDANRDGKRDISDPICTLNFLFRGIGAIRCEDAADGNDDGRVDIADAVTMLMYQFQGGRLPEPLAEEGHDGTTDALMCE